ncbi:hypothetical protein G7Z17_g12311 [Cylindrodendrum hubeiense]|uniref:FAD-binding FR-type domain-containing protein n=1 Tax=Cylindrodendrum hubeiense TaxID=595255 RepID=A0A9P5GVP7_9HYPO|nr:hypothetical protein G7Z17_g12311 [Cylindrodendrum hubeiense]
MGAGSQEVDPEVEQYHTWGEEDNVALSNYLFIICGAVSVAVIIWKLADVINKTVRKVACLNNDRQRYFAIPSSTLASVKRHVLYAPIFRKRHNREIQLSSAVNIGTLPTRFQLLFLTSYFATNVVFCVIDIPFAQTNEIAAAGLRNRAGVLSVLNMIPLFLLAGRNNPLIPLLGISFDTYNLIHRWFGRIVILEALVHTLAHYQKAMWQAAAFQATFSLPFLLWGFVATCAFVGLGLQAFSPIRHAYYEVFKIIHIALAILAIYALWIHLAKYDQLVWVKAAAGLWIADRALRVLRVLRSHVAGSRSRTIVEALPVSRLWQSHPFSIAWVDGVEDSKTERLASTRQDLMAPQQMRVSYIIRARTGFTDSLYKKALAAPGGRLETTCFSEGPYGGHHSLDSYGTAVLFAGGVGITHQVPYVQHLVAGYSEGTVATRKILLVWTIQSPEHLEWIRPWMTEILAMDKRRDVLRIMLFVSQPRSTKEIHSPSSTVQMFPGRPNIDTLLSMEQEHQVGTMAVSVCGPGALGDEVRRAVRARQDRSSIDFIEEAFTW